MHERGIVGALLETALLAVSACSEADREEPTEEAAWPAIDEFYLQAVYRGPMIQDVSDIWSRMPLETISLRSSGCYGTCPPFEMTLQRGGAAHFSGDSFVGALEGEFEGTLDVSQFARLCLFVDRFHFRDLDPHYSADWTDDNTITIRVTPVGGAEPIVVRDYGEQAPPEFMALQMAIELLVRRIEWE